MGSGICHLFLKLTWLSLLQNWMTFTFAQSTCILRLHLYISKQYSTCKPRLLGQKRTFSYPLFFINFMVEIESEFLQWLRKFFWIWYLATECLSLKISAKSTDINFFTSRNFQKEIHLTYIAYTCTVFETHRRLGACKNICKTIHFRGVTVYQVPRQACCMSNMDNMQCRCLKKSSASWTLLCYYELDLGVFHAFSVSHTTLPNLHLCCKILSCTF